ncbi:hypothetical protein [Paenibacillus qinlingensis]|uniref:hypothetical protein n=1 Tax=Paenibacillus qinlingensis TaxID=1837343 RepID=UPI001565BBBF|nr:hypothetical protein [Paenibacillus qinlingensis]NQX59944.1 hypothetical protein [Paenibacillus qinlingensis]
MIIITAFIVNGDNLFKLAQRRYGDSVENFNNVISLIDQQISESAIQFSNVLQAQLDASNAFTEVKSEARHIQIPPTDTKLSSESLSIPFKGKSTTSMPVFSPSSSNTGIVAQSNYTPTSASVTEDSKTQKTDLKDKLTVETKTDTRAKDADSTVNNLYSFLTGKKTPSKEDRDKVDSILNILQDGSLYMQPNVLSSLQGTANSKAASGKSPSTSDLLNRGSYLQTLLSTMYGNSAVTDQRTFDVDLKR